LHIATRKNVYAFQILPGIASLGHDIYEVLVVKAMGNLFRRVDMGIVTNRIIKDFEQQILGKLHLK
jgi:hypothetical protein